MEYTSSTNRNIKFLREYLDKNFKGLDLELSTKNNFAYSISKNNLTLFKDLCIEMFMIVCKNKNSYIFVEIGNTKENKDYLEKLYKILKEYELNNKDFEIKEIYIQHL